MYRVAVFVYLYLVRSCNSQNELFEGAVCTGDEGTGVCINIKSCRSALLGLRHEKHPQICSFAGMDPIVCCFDVKATTEAEEATRPLWTTDPGPATTAAPPETTTIPTTTSTDDTRSKFLGKETTTPKECPPVPPNKTAAKTGRKAWDKCIEYQEQLVLPCDTKKGKRYNYCRSDLNTWILDGEDAFEGEFPHMALLGYGSSPEDLVFLCGGSLISDRFVMTAGHCSMARDYGPVTYVLLGILKRSAYNASHLYKVRSVYNHPDYKPPKKYNDIALLQLDEPVKLSDLKVPACLDMGNMSESEVATATGWGSTELRGASADVLQKVDLARFTREECSGRFPASRNMAKGYDAKTQICYGDRKKGKDTCQGDSGGPLMVRHPQVFCMYTVIGITSFGRLCGVAGEPALYTRVAHYLPWIEGLVWPDQ